MTDIVVKTVEELKSAPEEYREAVSKLVISHFVEAGRDASSAIYVINADGSNETRLTDGGMDIQPDW